MTEPTPRTPLEVLALSMPKAAGVPLEFLQRRLAVAGIDIDLERLEHILAYLVAGEMVIEEEGRYRQARRVRPG